MTEQVVHQTLTRAEAIEAFDYLYGGLESIRRANNFGAEKFIESARQITAIADRGSLLLRAIPIAIDLWRFWRYEDQGILPEDMGAPIHAFHRRLSHYHGAAERILNVLRDDLLWKLHALQQNAAGSNISAPVVMDPKLERFLLDHSELLALCDSIDIAGVAVESGDRLEVVCVRVTAGCSDGSVTPDTLHRFGPWRAFRYRRPATQLSGVALALATAGDLRVDVLTEFVCAEPPRNLYRNDLVRTPDAVFTSGQARITWVGGNCGAKAFSDYADHEHFSRLVGTSDEYHDVPELVRRLSLRQALTADESRGVRFEIEPPLYFRRCEWTSDEAVLHFSVPACVDLTETRVKWQTPETRGTAPITPGTDGCTAVVATDGDQLEATVIYRSFSLWILTEQRPQRLADFFPEPELEEEIDDDRPDYSKFDTTRRSLRISIKKQVARDETLYGIIARDIEDAISCLALLRYPTATRIAA